MKLGTKTTVHNRFDFVVIEKGKPIKEFTLGDNNEYKASGTDVLTAHNVILNNMWTRLCSRNAFGGYIHVGRGSGTPSPSDTGLFTWVGAKAWTTDSQFRGFDEDGITPLGYWRGYIQYSETELNGTTISEVGVGYGASSSNIVTHALLQDAEGNPITFEKTNTKILRIYATIYATLEASDSNCVWIDPRYNPLLQYMTGSTFPSITMYASNARGNTGVQKHVRGSMNEPCLSASKTLSLLADTANKRIIASPVQFGSAEAKINCINSIGLSAIGFVNKNQYDNPNATGVTYTERVVGVGDGENKFFNVPSFNTEPSSVSSSTHGALTVHSGILPTYMRDSSLVDFYGMGSVYWAKYNMIKDADGVYKMYYYMNANTIKRMYGRSTWSADVTKTSTFNTLEEITTVFSVDTFGDDDGYVFDFANKTMRVGQVVDDVFSVPLTEYAIDFDEIPDTINRVFVYKDKRFLIIGSSHAYMYEQTSQTGFELLWKVTRAFNDYFAGNVTYHAYKDGKYFEYEYANMKSYFSTPHIVYDKQNDVFLVRDAGHGYSSQGSITIFYSGTSSFVDIAKYNPNTGLYDSIANPLPTKISNGATIYDEENACFFIKDGYENYETGVVSPTTKIAYVAKYNASTGLYDYARNDLPSNTYANGAIYDPIRKHILLIAGGISNSNPSSSIAYIAKYNVDTGLYDYTRADLPFSVYGANMAYDSTNDRIVFFDSNSIYANSRIVVAKYNNGTESYEYSTIASPVSVLRNSIAYNEIDDCFLIGYDNLKLSANVFLLVKYNPSQDSYDVYSNNAPSSNVRCVISYDKKSNSFLIRGNSNSYVAKYNHDTGLLDYATDNTSQLVYAGGLGWNPIEEHFLNIGGGFLYETYSSYKPSNANQVIRPLPTGLHSFNRYAVTIKNVSTDEYITTLLPHFQNFNNVYYFAIAKNQIAIDSGNNKKVITYNPDTMEYITDHEYTLTTGNNLTSTPELDVIVTGLTTQEFHHGRVDSYGTIGDSTAGAIAYLSDRILKHQYGMISDETCIPDGVSYVEFATAPPQGEEVKLDWHCRGYDKQGALGTFIFNASAYIQFGEV